MSSVTVHPQATLALFAYKQEAFIREAVEAALAQTYEPLEIILSDDASPDGTFEIMEAIVADYRGPHKVMLRRNPVNLGLTEHINTVARLISSDYTIMNAGDDVSLPHRVDRLMSIFLIRPDAFALLSEHHDLDENSVRTQSTSCFSMTEHAVSIFELIMAGGGIGKGATYAYRTQCFTWPDAIPHETISEDRLLPFRAALLGNVYLHDDALIYYRSSPQSLSDQLALNNMFARQRPDHWILLRRTLMVAAREGRKNTYILCIYSYIASIKLIITKIDMQTNGHSISFYSFILSILLRVLYKIHRLLSPHLTRQAQHLDR